MKKIIYQVIGLSFVFFTSTLSNTYAQHSENDNLILVGEINLSALEKFSWYVENFTFYKPEEEKQNLIQSSLQKKDIDIEVYFGTWCEDSQREVPRLIKLLNSVNFDLKKIKLIALDEYKSAPNLSKKRKKRLGIKMIPTIIFYENNKEINRFVEFARKTLEDDVLAILTNNEYKHSYK